MELAQLFYQGTMQPFDPKEYKRDMVVMHLHRKAYFLLVFPTGSTINDTSSFLEGIMGMEGVW
ncbi:hypothetical protein [Mucilaginibacter galii]|nr:hypothetical protein [Mucilaginibacter galii]